MNKTVFDLVAMLEAAEKVEASSLLTDAEKTVVVGEIIKALPPRLLCRSCEGTLELILNKLGGLQDGRTKAAPQKSPIKGTKVSKEGTSEGEKELLRKADGNRGRPRSKKRMVN